jgi:hypothetical protein
MEVQMANLFKKYGPKAKRRLSTQKLMNQYLQIRTGESLDGGMVETKSVSLSDQVEEVLMPLVSSLKELSQRPRKIQFLKDRIAKQTDEKEKWEEVKRKSKDLKMSKTIDKNVISYVDYKIDYLKGQLAQNSLQLHQLETREGSLFTNVSGMVLNFFKTKGKNLFLAFLSFLIFSIGLSFIKRQIVTSIKIGLQKRNAYVKWQWTLRPTRVILTAFTYLMSIFAAILTLYALNDWILVTIILLFIAGVAWSSKNALPQLNEQIKILLNFGPVREGERVEYKGIGWKVKKLGIYSTFENPWLSNATMRINSKKFTEMVSRPVNENEPWFPSKKGDWVELEDGSFGKVAYQSPQYVIVKLLGGHEKTYPTEQYLALNPVNLSGGFGVEVIFGVDYSHQKLFTNELLDIFRKEFKEKMTNEIGENSNHLKNIDISIHRANESSLDLRIFMICEGELAPYKLLVEREASKVLINICNQHNYVIPFNQMTVHMQQ